MSGVGGIDCPRQGRLIGGCKFEGRYDRGAADVSKLQPTIQILYAGEVLNNLRTLTYVHDICIRCGATVKRP